MERFIKEDLALFTVDAQLEDHYNELIIVAHDKIHRTIINCKRGMA
jgi:hypothetical protein